MRYLLLISLLFLFACTPTIDEAPFPQDQQAVRYSFKRMSEHGQIEPVLVEGQMIDKWYFEVLAGDGARVQRLGDGSGIDYQLNEHSTLISGTAFLKGQLVRASGEVLVVRRDYPSGTISATLKLSSITAAN